MQPRSRRAKGSCTAALHARADTYMSYTVTPALHAQTHRSYTVTLPTHPPTRAPVCARHPKRACTVALPARADTYVTVLVCKDIPICHWELKTYAINLY